MFLWVSLQCWWVLLLLSLSPGFLSPVTYFAFKKNHPAVASISFNGPTELYFLFKNQKSLGKKSNHFLWECGGGFFILFFILFSANTLVHSVLKHSLTSLDNWESPSLVLLSIKRWLAFPGHLSFPIGHCMRFAFRECVEKTVAANRRKTLRAGSTSLLETGVFHLSFHISIS